MRLHGNLLVYLLSFISGYSAMESGRNFGLEWTRNWKGLRAGPSGSTNEIPRGSRNLVDSYPKVVDLRSSSHIGRDEELPTVDSPTSGAGAKIPPEAVDLSLKLGLPQFNDPEFSTEGLSLSRGLHQPGTKSLGVPPTKRRRLSWKESTDATLDERHHLETLLGPLHQQYPKIVEPSNPMKALAQNSHGTEPTYNHLRSSIDNEAFDVRSRFFATIASYNFVDANEKELISKWWEKVDSDFEGQESFLDLVKQDGGPSTKKRGRSLEYMMNHSLEIREKTLIDTDGKFSFLQKLEGLIALATHISTREAYIKFNVIRKVEMENFQRFREELIKDPQRFNSIRVSDLIANVRKMNAHFIYLKGLLPMKKQRGPREIIIID